jgi:hypothetical protein
MSERDTTGKAIGTAFDYGRWISPTYIDMTHMECAGNAHVWACDRAAACKCGKAVRLVDHWKQ